MVIGLYFDIFLVEKGDILGLQNRALRGCGLVLKNRKTAHQNRGCGFNFFNF
jgi:hypothetical protein